MAISNASITTSGVDIFTCPGTLVTDVQEHAVTCLIFCNTSGADATLTVTATPQGGSAATLIKELSVPAAETFTFDTEKLVLSTGDKITALASANTAITVTVSSFRVS